MWRFTLAAVMLGMALGSCGERSTSSAKTTGGKLVFEDSFDRGVLGDRWNDTSEGKYSIVDGKLRVQGARNKPLWLKQRLPKDARIEFDALSKSPAVDIKVELYGDGKSFAKELSYTATSYVAIFGGWNNSRSIIARMNEHGADRVVRTRPKAKAGKSYHFSITRSGAMIEWTMDGEPFLKMEDSDPLAGIGHQFFAVNNWESEVFFDDLKLFEL